MSPVGIQWKLFWGEFYSSFWISYFVIMKVEPRAQVGFTVTGFTALL